MPSPPAVAPSLLSAGLAVYVAIATVVLGARRHDYRPVASTIARLAERGAPGARSATIFLFVPVGVAGLVLSVWIALRPTRFPELAAGLTVLAASIAVGYLGTALCPCDPGSPMRGGSPRQTVHELCATVAHVAAASALWLMGRTSVAAQASLQTTFFAGSCLLGVLFVLFSVEQAQRMRGLVERLLLVTTFAALVVGARLFERGTFPG